MLPTSAPKYLPYAYLQECIRYYMRKAKKPGHKNTGRGGSTESIPRLHGYHLSKRN